ncbi:hypothetical protein [Actinoplanes sp. NPDC020271]|uniref:hypothetical protein n=1 Tax=Actinoplanes sp. NPDC020271 TaxID=3363896 RepID=UPI0037A00045
MRKLWYAGAGVIAGGLLFLGAAPAQASPQRPGAADAVTPYTSAIGNVLADTNGLRLSSPIGTDPLGREPLLTVSRGDQQLFPVKAGRTNRPEDRPESSRLSTLPAADVVGTEMPKTAGVPLTDTNTGSVRLPLVGRLPIVGGLLPDGSRTTESAPARTGLVQDLTGMPLGGSPVAAADLLPEADATGSPAPGASPYSSTAARPGMVSPSADVPSVVTPSAVMPSAEAPVSVAPSSVAPSSVAPASAAPASAAPASAAPASAAPSEAPYTKASDDPRLLEEPVEGLTTR